MPQLHSGVANALLLYYAALAVWGTVSYLRNQESAPSFWGAVGIATYLALAQAVIGLGLMLAGLVPRDLTHLLYGATAVLSFPAARMYTANRSPRAQLGVTTLVAFFLIGVAIRGITTGR